MHRRRYCEHLRGRTPCRYLLFVRGTKEQPQAGIRHSQSARHPADQYDRRFSGHHQAPLRTGKRKVFQALRIEVNREMEALKEMLYAATEALKPGGRLVVITYHSLEDRMVKNIMKTGNIEGKAEKDFFGNVQTPFRLVNNKVIVPDETEIERNPRSRSAKLRIAEKIEK